MTGPLAGLLADLPAGHRLRARRAILEALLRERESLRVSRRLARHLGLRRRDLRHEIDRMIADGAPMRWQGRRRKTLGLVSHHVITLALSDDALSTLVFALRRSMMEGHSASDMRDATLILADVLRQMRPMTRGFTLPTQIGRASPPLAPMLPPGARPEVPEAVRAVREAMERQVKLCFRYTAIDNARTQRIVWPVTTTNHGTTLVAWCELRQAFRHFRLDQIAAPLVMAEPIPRLREDLMRAWRSETGDAPGQADDAGTGDPAA